MKFARKLLIIFYWLLITLIVLYDRRFLIQKLGLGHFVECTVVRVALMMMLAYAHLKWFIPFFFERGKLIVYVLLTSVSIAVYILLQQVYDIYLYGFVLGSEQNKSFHAASIYLIFTTIWYLVITVIFYRGLEWYEQSEQIRELELEIKNLKEKEAMLMKEEASSEIFVKSGTRKIKVDIEAITHIQGLKDYAILFTASGKLIVKGSLKNVEDLFPSGTMVRIHKSYLVARRKISSYSPSKVTIGNLNIPIGRSYKTNLEDLTNFKSLS